MEVKREEHIIVYVLFAHPPSSLFFFTSFLCPLFAPSLLKPPGTPTVMPSDRHTDRPEGRQTHKHMSTRMSFFFFMKEDAGQKKKNISQEGEFLS